MGGGSDEVELFGVSSSRSAALRGTGQEGTPKRACVFAPPTQVQTAQLNNLRRSPWSLLRFKELTVYV